MLWTSLVIVLLLSGCHAVIYSLNSSEYDRMPPLFTLDDFDACMSDSGGTYCLADLDLFSDSPSELLTLIQEYSADTKKHFNHTQLHRGVCVTRQCKHLNGTRDLNTTIEACVNETIWRDYGLQTRLREILYCKRDDDQIILDSSDLAVIIVYLIILSINGIGSLYDVLFCHQNSKSGNPYLLSFSIRRNWAKLVMPSGAGTDPKLERLKSFQGLRAMTMVCVILSHAALAATSSYIQNPQYIEKAMEDISKQILFNGNLVTHTFFVMSSFLLAYNFEINAEKHKVSWWLFPKGIIMRLIRLTPTYALTLATVSTVMRHIGSGPLWDLVVTRESNDCRQYWWTHILYIQNYIYPHSYCMTPTWYLAADTQLFCLGLFTCLLMRRPRDKKLGLTALFLISLFFASTTNYFMELDPIVYQSPEIIHALYTTDRTFHYMYVPGHTNLSQYVMGLAGGFLAYHWQTQAKDMKSFKKYRLLVWATVPLGVLLILSGGVFYLNEDITPTYFKVAYATFYKPLFQLLVLILILSCVFKIESVYRGIVEWRGLTWAGRLTYGAYLLHTLFQRGLIGLQRNTIYISDFGVFSLLAATLLFSYLASGLLWLFVEAPMAALSKIIMTRSKRVER